MNQADLSLLLPDMLPRLWSFALRLSRDSSNAEVLVRRACADGLERADERPPDRTPLHWMFSIVHSAWLESSTQRLRPRSNGTASKVIDAVDQLPDAQRVVMLLVYAEGLRYQEAADVLDVPVGTLLSRLACARQAVAASLDSHSTPQFVDEMGSSGLVAR